jgi:hypothetical protein
VARAEFEERVRLTDREGFVATNMKQMLSSITPKYGIWTLDDRKQANQIAREKLAQTISHTSQKKTLSFYHQAK